MDRLAEHRFGTAEGGLGVDYPVLGSGLDEECPEGRGLPEHGSRARKNRNQKYSYDSSMKKWEVFSLS
jgi:hypothetical protein